MILIFSDEIQKDIQTKAELQKQQVLLAASLDGTESTMLVNGETLKKQVDNTPVDVEGFIQEFMRKNQGITEQLNKLIFTKCLLEDILMVDYCIREIRKGRGVGARGQFFQGCFAFLLKRGLL